MPKSISASITSIPMWFEWKRGHSFSATFRPARVKLKGAGLLARRMTMPHGSPVAPVSLALRAVRHQHADELKATVVRESHLAVIVLTCLPTHHPTFCNQDRGLADRCTWLPRSKWSCSFQCRTPLVRSLRKRWSTSSAKVAFALAQRDKVR